MLHRARLPLALVAFFACGGKVADIPPSGDAGVDTGPPPTDGGIVTRDTGIGSHDSVPSFDTGIPMCVPKSCAQQGIDCGPAGDGCGGVLQCSTCTAPDTCGGGGQPGICGTPCTTDCATGTWTGAWKLVGSSLMMSGSVTMTLTETGTTVTGTSSFANEPCFQSATIDGTLSGSTLTATSTEGANAGSITATITGTSMSGTFTITGGTCAGYMGAFTMTD